MSNLYLTKRSRQILSFLLAMVMVFSTLGSYSLTTYAAGTIPVEKKLAEELESELEEFSTEPVLEVSENDVEIETIVEETEEVIEESETIVEEIEEATEESETVVEETEEMTEESETVVEETEEMTEESETIVEETEEMTEELETVVEETEEVTEESETIVEETEEVTEESETIVEETEAVTEETETDVDWTEEFVEETTEEVRTESLVGLADADMMAVEKEEPAESYNFRILADMDAVKISARVGAQAIIAEAADGGCQYTVSANDTVTVTVAANENYKITGAVTKNGDLAEKAEKSKATGFVYSVKISGDVQTQIKTEALYQALLMQEESVISKVKDAYTVSPGVYIAKIQHGNADVLLNEVTVENALGEKTVGKVSEDGYFAEFSVDSKDAGNAKLKYKVKTADGQEFVFALKVRPSIQKVTVKGVKNGVLKQTVDTEKTYKISLTPATANIDDLYIVSEGDIEAVLEKNQLKVITKTTVGEKKGAIRFYQKTDADENGAEIINAAISITSAESSALKKAKPTVKLTGTDDTSLTLALGVAASIEKPVQGAQYYEIKITPDATQSVPQEIADACRLPIYRLREGNSQVESVSVNTIQSGKGQQWKYSVEVRLVQTTEKKNAQEVSEQDIKYNSKVKSIKASTLKPAYETVLKVKKGAGSIYTGQGEVCIATPVFSKNTSYRELDKVLDITSGLAEEEKLQLTYKDGKIYAMAPAGSQVAIGKHTMIAYAVAPEGSKAATVTFTVNVVRGIEDLSVVVPTTQLYKKYNKAVSAAVITSYNELVTEKLPEAKTKKVIYSIVDVDGNAFTAEDSLYGMVTVKKGKVTVNKNYIVSSNKKDNVFCIKATANDFKGNTVCAYSDPVEICSTTITPGAVVLVSKELNADNAYTVISRGNATLKIEDLNGAKIVVAKTGTENKTALSEKDILDLQAFQVTASNKAVAISADGSIGLEQAVKNLKITAVTKDGSNLKAVLEKLTVEYSDALALGVNISRATYCYTGADAQFYTIGSPDSATVTYSAGKNEIFKLDVMCQDEDGNWLPIEEDAYMNYTLSLTGAKQISKDKDTYLISATDAQTVITLTDKANNKKKSVYKLINEALLNKKLPSLSVTTTDTLKGGYYEGRQSLTLNVTAGGDYSYYDEDGFYKYAEVRVDVTDSVKNKEKYESFTKYTSDIDGYHEIFIDTEYEYDEEGNETGSTTTRTISLSFSEEEYTNILAGNYKLNVTLGTVKHGDFIPDTKTASVTVKAEEYKVPQLTFKPTTSYVLYTKDADSVELQGSVNKTNYTYSYTGLHNVIENGEVNKFKNYFEFVPADTINNIPAKLRLKQGITLADISDFDKKAFVDYQIYDVDGRVVMEDSALVKVDVKDSFISYRAQMLSFVMKYDGSTMFTTGDITRKSKPVDISHALFLSDTYTVSANGTPTVTVLADKIPDRSSERIDLYVVPKGSYYEAQLDACRDSGDTAQYEKLMQEYGVKIKSVMLKFVNESNRKINISSSTRLLTKNFTRENKLSGEYIVPLTVSKSTQAVEIDRIEVSEEDAAYARMDVVKDVNGKATITLVIDKYNLALAGDRMKTIRYTVYFTHGMHPEEKTIRVVGSSWQTYEKALDMVEKLSIKSGISSKWTGDRNASVEKAMATVTTRLGKSIRADSNAILTVSKNDTDVVAPTRIEKGSMKVYATLINTIPELSYEDQETQKEYTINVNFPALGAWPEDIAGELDTFLNNYQTEEKQQVFNHTKAEDIANAIKAQEFVNKYDWFRVDVSNVIKHKATELKDGSLSARVRIIDTTRRGADYDQIWTWTLYKLDSLQEAADRLTADLASVEVNNRITQETTGELIDGFIINEDIKWSWKKITVNGKTVDDYTKTLATAEQTGLVTGTIILQNPKSVVDSTQTVEVPISIQIQKMTDPAVIYSMVDGVVGQNALTYEMFCEESYFDEESGDYVYKRLSEKEMREVVLDTANQVLKEADELYYVEYAKDEDEKDIFKYQPMTYKYDESVSYTLVIRDECTDEIVGEAIVVNEFVLSWADPELQKLTEWQADIEELIEIGNTSGSFTNDITDDSILGLAESVRKNSTFASNLKYTYDEETGDIASDFVLNPATMEAAGSATATLYLVEEYYNDETGEYIQKDVITMSVKLFIPELDQSIDEAVAAINNTITNAQDKNAFSNKTTAADILTMVKENIKNKKFSVEWSQPFTLEEATMESAGSITGEILITNKNPGEGEALSEIVAVSIMLAKLKTADEAKEALTDIALSSIVEKANTATAARNLILAFANQIVQHDGFTVSIKQENGVEIFGYRKNSYKEDGYVYCTLLITSDAGIEEDTREVVLENETLPKDVTLQTSKLALTDVSNAIKELANNGEITNDTTLDELIIEARRVIVNPSLQIFDEDCSMKLTAATEMRTGKLYFNYAVCDDFGRSVRGSVTVTIPRLTTD